MQTVSLSYPFGREVSACIENRVRRDLLTDKRAYEKAKRQKLSQCQSRQLCLAPILTVAATTSQSSDLYPDFVNFLHQNLRHTDTAARTHVISVAV